MKKLLAYFLAMCLVFGVACASGETVKNGGVLKIAAGTVTIIGIPAKSSTFMEMQAISPCVETLARYGEGGVLVPWLATGWTLDAENEKMTITLRDGVLFHDGTPFNAEAVKWNLLNFQESGRNEIAAVAEIEVVDDTNLVLHMNGWSSAIDENVLYTAGYMISPTFYQANDADTVAATPVGTGPFKFVKWERSVKIVYEKSDTYWIEGQPYLDGIEMHFFSDANTVATAMLNGEIDACITGDATVDELLRGNGWTPVNGALPTNGLMHGVCFASNNPEDPFYDVRVRRAFCHAIDARVIADMFGKNGIAEYTNQWNIPGAWSFSNECAGYEYDVEKAKALLAEAGYKDGLSVNYYYNAGSVLYGQIAQVMQAYVAEAGIDLVLKPIAQALQDEMVGLNGGWDGIMEWAAQAKPYLAQLYARAFFEGGPRFSASTLKPADLQELINKGIAAKTQVESATILPALSRMVIDDYCLLLPFCVSTNSYFADPAVKSHGLGAYISTTWTPESCWLDR